MSNTSTAFRSPEELLAQLEAHRAQSSGPRADWFSLQDGTNVVRFVSDGSVSPFHGPNPYWVHRGVRDDGKFTSLVDLDWVCGKEGAAVLAASCLTAEDTDLVGRYGDPVSQIRDAILPDDKDSDEYEAMQKAFSAAKYAPKAGRQAMAVAAVEGGVGLMRLPVTVFDNVYDTFKSNPTIISPTEGADFKITRTGKGFGTKYNVTLDLASNGKPVELPSDAKFPDPVEGVAKDVVSYRDKVAFCKRSYSEFIPDGFVFGGME